MLIIKVQGDQEILERGYGTRMNQWIIQRGFKRGKNEGVVDCLNVCTSNYRVQTKIEKQQQRYQICTINRSH